VKESGVFPGNLSFFNENARQSQPVPDIRLNTMGFLMPDPRPATAAHGKSHFAGKHNDIKEISFD